MKFYNNKFKRLLVDLHLQSICRFNWRRIIGVQIGNWFFGAIKGGRYEEDNKTL